MAKKLIFLIEMEKDSLLAAGLILELNGYRVMVSGKSEDPIKKILSHENSRKVPQRVYFLLFLATKLHEGTRRRRKKGMLNQIEEIHHIDSEK